MHPHSRELTELQDDYFEYFVKHVIDPHLFRVVLLEIYFVTVFF